MSFNEKDVEDALYDLLLFADSFEKTAVENINFRLGPFSEHYTDKMSFSEEQYNSLIELLGKLDETIDLLYSVDAGADFDYDRDYIRIVRKKERTSQDLKFIGVDHERQ